MPEKLLDQMTRFVQCFTFALVVFTYASLAFAIHAEVVPPFVLPGDAFIVRLSGIAPSQKASVLVEGTEVPLVRCGVDCAFGIGAVGTEMLPAEKSIIISSGSDRLTLTLTIWPTIFPEMRLTLPQSKVSLSPEDLARAKKEEERLEELWRKTTPRLYKGEFMLPLQNPVSAVFGARRIINNKTVSVHRGIDLKGKQGEEIKAANYGRIVLEEELFFGGNTIIIDHGSGIYTIYMHLDRFAVNAGELVERGDIIGFVGASGRATGPHLHFGVKILTISANPLSLVRLQINNN